MRTLRGVSIALTGFAVALPAAAQDSTRVRAVSAYEAEVNRVAKEIEMQRRLQIEFLRAAEEAQARARAVRDDGERRKAVASVQSLMERFTSATNEQIRLRRELETLCSIEPKPEGWIGVTLNSGRVRITRPEDGPMVFRYIDSPIVESVDPGSPADKSGVRSGDMIVAINGQRLRESGFAPAEILHPGARATLTLVRGGDTRTLNLVVEQRPEVLNSTPCPWIDATLAYALSPTPFSFGQVVRLRDSSLTLRAEQPSIVRQRPTRRDSLRVAVVSPERPAAIYTSPMASLFGGPTATAAGMQLVQMNAELGEAFGVDEGLLVVHALPGTAAHRAGLRGGDVLLTADDVKLTSARVLERVVSQSTTREVRLSLVRRKQEQTILLRW